MGTQEGPFLSSVVQLTTRKSTVVQPPSKRDKKTMSTHSQLWWRKFTRTAGPDRSLLMTQKDLDLNLENDFFGRWLQQGQNSLVHTLDDLLKVFYGEKTPIYASSQTLT